MCKNISKKQKIFISLAVVLVIIIALLTTVFIVENRVRFTFYSNGTMENLSSTYDFNKVLFIAHRGMSETLTDNTKEAFTLAANTPGVYGIETDVWVTKDGKFVCMHDADSVQGFSTPRDATFEEITTTPLKVDNKSYAPSFREYLDICKDGNKTAIVELKDKKITHDEIDAIMQEVEESGVDVVYISFNYEMLTYIRSKDADAHLQMLVATFLLTEVDGSTVAERTKNIIDNKMDLSIMYDFLTQDLVKEFHGNGLKVGVWTVDDEKHALILATEYGVDYITSNRSMKQHLEKYIEDIKD